jgi:AcrR family transcriptional regulator
MSDADVTACRPGRPRSTAADQAILDATSALFAERGYAGITIEAVADRAGVAKSTIYRRYADKADLVLAAVECTATTDTGPTDTGSLREDLRAIARNLVLVFTTTDVGKTLPATIAAMARHPELAQAHQEFLSHRRRAAIEAVTRGRARGEVAPDTDPDLLVDMVAGPIFYRTFVRRIAIDDRTLTTLVDAALAAHR